jgi:hypothetical protein
MSIFDLSSSGGKKKAQKVVSSPKPVSPIPSQSISDDKLRESLGRMKELSAQLSESLESVLQKSGHTLKEVTDFCQNPSNFSKEDWEKMQRRKEEMEVQITGKSKESLAKEKVKKQDSAASKQRRGKTLGARKNWIDMR